MSRRFLNRPIQLEAYPEQRPGIFTSLYYFRPIESDDFEPDHVLKLFLRFPLSEPDVFIKMFL